MDIVNDAHIKKWEGIEWGNWYVVNLGNSPTRVPLGAVKQCIADPEVSNFGIELDPCHTECGTASPATTPYGATAISSIFKNIRVPFIACRAGWWFVSLNVTGRVCLGTGNGGSSGGSFTAMVLDDVLLRKEGEPSPQKRGFVTIEQIKYSAGTVGISSTKSFRVKIHPGTYLMELEVDLNTSPSVVTPNVGLQFSFAKFQHVKMDWHWRTLNPGE